MQTPDNHPRVLKTPELATQFSIEGLQYRNRAFQKDRMLIDYVNSNPYRCRKLLVGEVRELNGRDKVGYFAEDGNREDYRQQEVSDIVLFVMTLADSLGLELTTEKVQQKVNGIDRFYGIPAVGPEKAMAAPPEMLPGSHEEVIYEKLKHDLNSAASHLETIRLRQQIRLTEASLYNLLGICFSLYHLFGVNPYRATREKIARNELKYVVFKASLPTRKPGQTDRGYHLSILAAYERYRREGSASWSKADGTRFFYAGENKTWEYDDARYGKEWNQLKQRQQKQERKLMASQAATIELR